MQDVRNHIPTILLKADIIKNIKKLELENKKHYKQLLMEVPVDKERLLRELKENKVIPENLNNESEKFALLVISMACSRQKTLEFEQLSTCYEAIESSIEKIEQLNKEVQNIANKNISSKACRQADTHVESLYAKKAYKLNEKISSKEHTTEKKQIEKTKNNHKKYIKDYTKASDKCCKIFYEKSRQETDIFKLLDINNDIIKSNINIMDTNSILLSDYSIRYKPIRNVLKLTKERFDIQDSLIMDLYNSNQNNKQCLETVLDYYKNLIDNMTHINNSIHSLNSDEDFVKSISYDITKFRIDTEHISKKIQFLENRLHNENETLDKRPLGPVSINMNPAPPIKDRF